MVMALLRVVARAYVNHGRWIAECPRDCGYALQLEARQTNFHCTECKWIGPIEWPDNPDEIWNVLEKRVVPRTRNWFPSNHDLALRSGSPHGQTVAQLLEETEANEVK